MTILTNAQKQEREETIISMRQKGHALQEIGDKLKITKERVRQIILEIKKEKGEQVFSAEDPLLTGPEVAQRIGVSRAVINRACKEGMIPCQQKPGNIAGLWLIKESDIEEVKKNKFVSGKRNCEYCGKEFICKPRFVIRKTCSKKCFKARRRKQRDALIAKGLSQERLKGWRRELWSILQEKGTPNIEQEEWLPLGKAMQISGLSKTQVIWASICKLVTTHPSPNRKWRGRPVVMYAKSEMEIARQVAKACNGKH